MARVRRQSIGSHGAGIGCNASAIWCNKAAVSDWLFDVLLIGAWIMSASGSTGRSVSMVGIHTRPCA